MLHDKFRSDRHRHTDKSSEGSKLVKSERWWTWISPCWIWIKLSKAEFQFSSLDLGSLQACKLQQ